MSPPNLQNKIHNVHSNQPQCKIREVSFIFTSMQDTLCILQTTAIQDILCSHKPLQNNIIYVHSNQPPVQGTLSAFSLTLMQDTLCPLKTTPIEDT